MLKRSLSVLSSLPSLRMEFETTYARFLSPVRRYAFSHEESKNRNRVLSTSSIARLDCASSKNEKRRIETSLDEVFRKEGRIPLNVSFLYSPNIFIPQFPFIFSPYLFDLSTNFCFNVGNFLTSGRRM